jgi:diadenosine tetraphosphatase ApaH/serine/threonine PP2A family protein phosphatase
LPEDGLVEPVCGNVPAVRLDRDRGIAPDTLPEPSRWAAVSDVHGQADLLLALLQAHGIVDAARAWAWGDGVLVVTGDVFDRGPAQLEALWALYRLAQEARAAGGRVELLLGNHEAMVLAGDLRYLHPRYHEVAARLGRSYDRLFAGDTELGAWLRRRATVLQLGDTLFVHGGLHPSLATAVSDIAALNAAIRGGLGRRGAALHDVARGQWLFGTDGPLWYRGYFVEPRAGQPEIEAMLAAAGASRIVVGHTTHEVIQASYDERVIVIDAAMKAGIAGEVLLRDGGAFWRGLMDGTRLPLPGSDGAHAIP